jgi:4-amino-4-deoxy-L-arabinose transferase-like glycosyltransferase
MRTLLAPSPAAAAPERGARLRRPALPLALYALGVMVLVARLGSHPAFAYNWEHYTTWRVLHFIDHPSWRIFGLDEGLMTDSGGGPASALPVWLSFKLIGVSLLALRLPCALLAATAVPALWLLGRRLVSAPVGLLAALLLACSPAWWLYGRTATTVGMSLAPALATIYALLRLLEHPEDRRWLVALQGCLLAGVYFYAPIRFLWLLSLGLLAVEWWLRPSQRVALQRALLVTMAAIPLWITLLTGGHPLTAFDRYYGGRGEQILNFGVSAEGYADALGQPTPQGESLPELARRLLGRNLRDYVNLLLDRHTDPVYLDFAGVHGRLYPWFLAPFAALGLARALRRMRASLPDRVLLATFFGLGLPMILTTRVHTGRLIFVLPLLLVLVADGAWATGTWLARRAPARLGARQTAWPVALAALLLCATVASGWRDDRGQPVTPPVERLAGSLSSGLGRAQAAGGAALVLGGPDWQGEFESINLAPARLTLDAQYQFIDLSARHAPPSADSRTPLYYGGVLWRIVNPLALPSRCRLAYFVLPPAETAFLAAMRLAGCASPDYTLLQ